MVVLTRPARPEKSEQSSSRLSRAAGLAVAFAVGGVLGLLLWWRVRRAGPRTGRLPRVRRAALILALALVVVGSVNRLGTAIAPAPGCAQRDQFPPAASAQDNGILLLATKIATWVPSGLALLYVELHGDQVCVYGPRDQLVAAEANRGTTDAAVTIGDVVLTGPSSSYAERPRLADHESRHRTQWAWFTLAAGPFAFPAAYWADEFFFPDSRNHFERAAGLRDGDYTPAGAGPVLGWPQLAVLELLATTAVTVLAWRRARRAAAYSRLDSSTAGDATGPETHRRETESSLAEYR